MHHDAGLVGLAIVTDSDSDSLWGDDDSLSVENITTTSSCSKLVDGVDGVIGDSE